MDQSPTIPRKLADELVRRYEEHGGEYVSEEKTEDSMPINLCMSKDNLIDVEEELTDAIFNALVFKLRKPNLKIADTILNLVINCWIVVYAANYDLRGMSDDSRI